MQKPPWSSEKRRLARRIYTGYILRELSFWVPVGLLFWGLMVFTVRFVSGGRTELLLSGGTFLLASIGIGVYRGYRRASDVNLTAVLDYLTASNNLLVSLEETGAQSDEWVSAVERRLDDEVPMPAIRWGSLSTSILPALAFLLLVWLVPLSGFSDRTTSASSSYLKERVEELREELNTVESEDLMSDEKAEQVEQKLNQLKEDLENKDTSGDNPWSVMDRVDRELEEQMAEGSDTLNRARKLSRSLSEKMKEQSDEPSKEASSDSSNAKPGTGQGKSDENETDDRVEQEKEELSRALARLSRKEMIPDPSSMESKEEEDTNYEDRQGSNSTETSSSDKSNENVKRNWKRLASRRKALEKLRRKLEEKHRRMHRKGLCRGGRCQLKKKGKEQKSLIAGRPGKKGQPASDSTSKQGESNSTGRPSGKPGPDSGSSPLTDGETDGANESDFSTKEVAAPIVNPEGSEKLAERIQEGENQKPGEASVSSGQDASVEDPLESRRSSVPPAYRDSVKSYFSHEKDN